MLITGEVAAVTASIEHAKTQIGEKGMFLNSSVIPSPDEKIWSTVL
jgi:microcompartment protein CcmL/EutN